MRRAPGPGRGGCLQGAQYKKEDQECQTIGRGIGVIFATADQAGTDHHWNAIVDNGGAESECGWCTDKCGISWQITPIATTQPIIDPDRAAAKRSFGAMMTMTKIEIAAIEAARSG